MRRRCPPGQRSVVEDAVAELRALADCIEGMAPCKVTVNVPPPDSREPVTVEIWARLTREKAGV
jgi:hypothetical protein